MIREFTTDASEGDIAQCRNGHDVYRVKTSIAGQTLISSSCFEAIGEQPEPVNGAPIEPCCICGEPWLVMGTAGGWRMTRIKAL